MARQSRAELEHDAAGPIKSERGKSLWLQRGGGFEVLEISLGLVDIERGRKVTQQTDRDGAVCCVAL
jgi:hypothetical protein